MKKFLLALSFFIPSIFIDAQTVSGTINGHDYVDLGLPSGTLWSTCYVGANNPLEKGNYYAWGETETKSEFSWDSYMCQKNECGTDKDPLKDFVYPNDESIAGTQFDVAHVKWGGTWRMPTRNQIYELSGCCYWVWTNSYNNSNISGYIVYKVKDNNDYRLSDTHIFFPYLTFWTASPASIMDKAYYAYEAAFDLKKYDEGSLDDALRYCAIQVRPVAEAPKPDDIITFEDSKFEKYCIENFDTNNDGKIQIKEAETVNKINCSNLGIVSLSGIEYFKNLVVLECYDNNINELYLTNNTLLEGLDCGNNEIYVLEVNGCNHLEHLDCNMNCISELDLTTNTGLRYLNCSINRLSELNLTNNKNIRELHCAYNKLSVLDISNNNKLYKLVCHDNPIDILYLLSTQEFEEFNIPESTTFKYKDSGMTDEKEDFLLIMELSNGNKEVYALSDKPVVTFKGNNLSIESDKISTTYSINSIKKYYFEKGNSTEIETPSLEDSDFSFRYVDGNTIQISGANTAEVYNLSGMNVRESKGNGQIEISLENLPSGIYIIKTNNKTIKIKK